MFRRAATCLRELPSPLQGVLLLWFVLALAVAARTISRPGSHTVFPVLAEGARHWWADEPVYADYHPRFDHFRYPPLLAIGVTPFAELGYRWGGVSWSWLNLAVFGWGLWRFMKDVLPTDWSVERQGLFLALATLGGLRSFWNGQSNVLTVGLLLLGVASLVRGRSWPAAFWLSGSLLVKLTPIPILLLLVAIWPRQLLGRMALVLALGIALPFSTRPPEVVAEQYADMAEQMRETSSERWPGFRDAWTMWLVAEDVIDSDRPFSMQAPVDSPAYRAMQLLTAAGAFVACLTLKRRRRSAVWLTNVTLAIGSAWLLLFGHAVEHPTYVFLAPSLAWAVMERSFPGGRKLILSAGVLILGLGWGGLTRPWQETVPDLVAILPLGTTLFALWLVLYVRSCRAGAKKVSRPMVNRRGAAA